MLNFFQSFFIISVTAMLLSVASFLIYGITGIVIALFSWLFLALLIPVIDPQSVLKLYKGRKLDYYEAPNLYAALYNLSQNASLQNPPKIYFINDLSFTAFSTGTRNNSAIALSKGLVNILSERELYGVLAHEISHIKNNDIWVMQLTDIASRIAMAAAYLGQAILIILFPFIFFEDSFYFLLLFIVFLAIPPLILLMQLFLSRIREYGADIDAVILTGDPNGLKNALLKLDTIEENFFNRYFNPFYRSKELSVLRTHPDIKKRVKRLEELKVEDFTNDFIYEKDENFDAV